MAPRGPLLGIVRNSPHRKQERPRLVSRSRRGCARDNAGEPADSWNRPEPDRPSRARCPPPRPHAPEDRATVPRALGRVRQRLLARLGAMASRNEFLELLPEHESGEAVLCVARALLASFWRSSRSWTGSPARHTQGRRNGGNPPPGQRSNGADAALRACFRGGSRR
jgi:hypothetical protein